MVSGNPRTELDAELMDAPAILRAGGFSDVPDGYMLASSPEWLLKLAAVIALRNVLKLERSGVKDLCKLLVDIATGGTRAGVASEGGSVESMIERLLTGEGVDVVSQIGVGEEHASEGEK